MDWGGGGEPQEFTNFSLVKNNWERYFVDPYDAAAQWCQLTVRMSDAFSHNGPLFSMVGYKTHFNSKGYTFYNSLDIPIDVQNLRNNILRQEHTANSLDSVHSAVPSANFSTSTSSSSSSSTSRGAASAFKRLSQLEEALITDSRTVIRCVGLAIEVARADGHELSGDARIVTPRFFNLRQLTTMKQIKANHVGLFVALRGNVVRASNVRPKPTSMKFKCEVCGELAFSKSFVDGRYEAPTRCEPGKDHNPPCKNRKFIPLRNSARTVDFQQVKLQELGGRGLDAGRIPRTIAVELNDTLCNKCVPGDVVTIVGEIKTIRTDELESRRSNEKKSTYLLYMEAHSITMVGGGKRRKRNKSSSSKNASMASSSQNSNNSDDEEEDDGNKDEPEREKANKLDEFQFTEKDIQAIAEIIQLKESNPFEFLVASLCPSIVGNHLVKAGLLLALFGGTNNGHLDEKNSTFQKFEKNENVVNMCSSIIEL